MTTLFDALLGTAQLVGMTRSGVTTSGGNLTTIIDTTLMDTSDSYNGGDTVPHRRFSDTAYH